MKRISSRSRFSPWRSAALVAGATLWGGCVVAAPPGAVVVRPPVAVSVQFVQPGWEYFQVGGVWYYGPPSAHRGRHRGRPHHSYYVLRGGAWVFIR